MNNELYDWDQLFEQLPVDTSVSLSHQQELRAKVLQTFEDNAAEPSRTQRLKEIGHILMKHKAPHWTVAALLIVGLVWIASSGGRSALALDEVIDNFTNARTARFDMTVKVVGQPEQKMKAFYLEPSHFRQELVNGYINIADWAAGKMIGLDPQSKQATVINLVNLPEDQRKAQMNQFEAMRDLLRKAVDDPNVNVESLGKKQLDGRNVVGFRFDTPTNPMTVWADPETKFPVQIESTMIGPPETTVVMSNYEFNVELDESSFRVEVPEGYNVLETEFDASPATEQDLLTSLQIGSDLSDGEFPPGFDSVAIASYVASLVVKESLKSNDKKPTEAQMQMAVKIGRGLQFALTLPPESDAHYAGAEAKRDEQDRPIFWYKPKGAQEYRVIYADLSVKESATAPEVEGAKKLSR